MRGKAGSEKVRNISSRVLKSHAIAWCGHRSSCGEVVMVETRLWLGQTKGKKEKWGITESKKTPPAFLPYKKGKKANKIYTKTA
jgi:hypothetical protein